APTALYVIGDVLVDRGDWAGAARWFGELLARYPADLRSSLARFRLAARAVEEGRPDSAQRLYQTEVHAAGPQRNAARFWRGRLRMRTHCWRGATGSPCGGGVPPPSGSPGRRRSTRPTTRACCAPSSRGRTAPRSRPRRGSSASTR